MVRVPLEPHSQEGNREHRCGRDRVHGRVEDLPESVLRRSREARDFVHHEHGALRKAQDHCRNGERGRKLIHHRGPGDRQDDTAVAEASEPNLQKNASNAKR